jgi:photosystem II stability/assembly factor-like uncharacterized protein
VRPRIRAVALAVTAVALAASAAPAAGAVQVSQSGWQWGNPAPQGTTLRAMDVVGDRAFAVGDGGTALRTDDGGASWTGLATGTSRDLGRVQAVTTDVVVVHGGDGCVVRRSDDAGRTFRRIFVLAEVDCPQPVAAVRFVDPQTGYLLLRDGNVLRTTDAGRTFSRQTAIPGTPASAGGGTGVPADALFTTPEAGVVFIARTNTAWRTTDAGASWTPEPDVEPGQVERLRRTGPETAYAFGPDTLLRTTDGGQTWTRRAAGTGTHVTDFACATETLCLLSTARGDVLLRTEDAGASAEPVTAATAALYAVAFTSPTRAVATGAAGATVVSDDAGRTYAQIGGDIGGSYPLGLRLGPDADTTFALGTRGQLARTTDGGARWQSLNVATSADLRDVAFSSRDTGYALDTRGGLFRTTNGGQSWEPLDPGTTAPPRAVLTAGDAVLLAGPRGIRRATRGGQFDLVADGAARRVPVDAFDRAGSAIFVSSTTAILRSTDAGRTWRRFLGPRVNRRGKRVSYRLQALDMTSASSGYAITVDGRVWRTTSSGRRWTELGGVGSGGGQSLAFGSPTSGYLTLSGYAGEPGASYVLRTGDGGRTWRPQRIAAGAFPATLGVVAPSATRAYALTSTPALGREVVRSLFSTSSGGDFGSPSRLRLRTDRQRLSRAALRRAGGRLTVGGVLEGAQGGERIVVSHRPAGAPAWRSQVVTAGANGGRFTATVRATGTTEVVAQWSGDSGRQGAGTAPLRITVR